MTLQIRIFTSGGRDKEMIGGGVTHPKRQVKPRSGENLRHLCAVTQAWRACDQTSGENLRHLCVVTHLKKQVTWLVGKDAGFMRFASRDRRSHLV